MTDLANLSQFSNLTRSKKNAAEVAGIDQAVEGNRWESMIRKAVEVRQGLTEAKAEAL